MGKVIMSGVSRCMVDPRILNNLKPVLNDNSWEQIRAASDAGIAPTMWNVGDTKRIIINGQVGNTTFSNLSIDAVIIGFDHNAEIEGSNRIHFKIGSIGGAQVSLVDESNDSLKYELGYFNMNFTNTNVGGWASSYMRTTTLGNDGTPDNPLSGSLLATLPTELLTVMKPVIKYSDNTGGASNKPSNVTATTDYLFLLSEREYLGTQKYANSAEWNYQLQYDYYKNGNSTKHNKHLAITTGCNTHSRSVRADNAAAFASLNSSGGHATVNAVQSNGMTPAFCV